MKKHTGIALLLLAIFILSLGVAIADDGKATVTTSGLNVRSGPGTTHSRITQLPKGTVVPVVKIEKGWAQIRLTQGSLGWVSTQYLQVTSQPGSGAGAGSASGTASSAGTGASGVNVSAPATGTLGTGVINSTAVNVRKDPTTESQALGQLARGELVQLLEKRGDWYRVKTGKIEGWVAGFLITVQGESADPRIYYVNQNLVNLRSAPNLNAQVLAQLTRNTPLTVSNQNGDWYQVKTQAGQEGWIAGWLISQADGSSVLQNQTSGSVIYPQNPESTVSGISKAGIKVNDTIVIKESVVNVRQGPGLTFQIVSRVNAGQSFTVIDAEDTWLKIRLSGGSVGWIADWLVFKKEDTQEVKRQDLVFDDNQSARIPLGAGKFLIITNTAEHLDLELLPVSIEEYRISKPTSTQIAIDFPEIALTPVKVQVNKYNINSVDVTGNKVLINFADKTDFRSSYLQDKQAISIRLRNYVDTLAVISQISVSENPESFVFEILSDKEISYESQRLSLDQIAFFVKGARLNLAGQTSFSRVVNDKYQITARQDSQDVVRVDLKFVYGSSIRVTFKDKLLSVAVGYPTQGPQGKIVVIDPGHGTIRSGGWVDPGAISPFNRVRELDVTVAISLKVEEMLRQAGVQVVMTHRGTTFRDLYDRANLANNENAYCFVSIHANASTNRAVQGVGVYYYAPEWMPEIFMQRLERQNLAKMILDEAVQATGRPVYGIFEDNFAVIRETRMPSVLVETGFLTNQQEEQLLANPAFQERMARGIANGILAFLNQ